MNAISQTWYVAGAGEAGRPTCSAQLTVGSSALCSRAFSSAARVLNTARVIGDHIVEFKTLDAVSLETKPNHRQESALSEYVRHMAVSQTLLSLIMNS